MKTRVLLVLLFLLVVGVVLVNAQEEQSCADMELGDAWYRVCLEKIATNTSVSTPIPYPTPTQEVVETPVATDTPQPPVKVCSLRALSNINVRADTTTQSNVIGSWEQGIENVFTEFVVTRDYLWGKHATGYSAVYDYTTGWYVAGTQGALLCPDVVGWDKDLIPPQPFASINPRGIHLFIGENCNLLANHISEYGLVKGITSNQDCLKLLHAISPETFLIWRNWVREGHTGDGPLNWGLDDPVQTAEEWWALEYATWLKLGLIQADRSEYSEDVIDLFEYRNELAYVGEWEHQFDLRILELANANHICLGVFSDGYGNPELDQFNERTVVLDYMLDHECQPGRYHMIATHSYSRYDSGMWLFERWRLQRMYWRDRHGTKYDSLQWVFTEQGIRNIYGEYLGRDPADCSALYELDIVDQIYLDSPEVLGYNIFAYGSAEGWTDFTPCIGG